MNRKSSILIKFLAFQCLPVLCASQDFDFFYFVQQWPGSYFDSKKGCCYPRSGKPASDFSIHGLWPNYNNGSYQSNCNPQSDFDPSKISDLTSRIQREWPSLACPSSDNLKFWSHEWIKHGTCSVSVLNQHDYFKTSLNLKEQLNLLEILANSGIQPNGEVYDLGSVKDVIKQGTGFTPWIECNHNESGNSQLYQVYMCVDTSGSSLIECPVFPNGKCGSNIEFPSFLSRKCW